MEENQELRKIVRRTLEEHGIVDNMISTSNKQEIIVEKIAKRCVNKAEEVHHKRRTGMEKELLNDISNGEALCKECHSQTSTYGLELPSGEESPPDFSEKDKQKIKELAEWRCECTRVDCHTLSE